MKQTNARLAVLVACSLFAAMPTQAQDAPPPADSAEQMAKDLANPVASMISVPFQFNVDDDVGPYGGVKSTLNIQPVIPAKLSDGWNVIIRTIVPIVHQNDVTARGTSQFGLGDVTQSFFFSPAKPSSSGITWAVGPALLYPTGTSNTIGSEKWGAGPTALVLKQSGPITFGLLANHIWSIAGDDDRADISTTFIQPFFSHTSPTAFTVGVNAETSYDWIGDQWVVPVNFSFSQLTKMGNQPVSVGAGFRYYVEKPAGGPDWGIRLTTTFLFR